MRLCYFLILVEKFDSFERFFGVFGARVIQISLFTFVVTFETELTLLQNPAVRL